MVYENAIFTIPEHQASEFVDTVQAVGGDFLTWPGCGGVRLMHCVEVPERFILVIEWESIDSHLAFRASDGFTRWREATAQFRDTPVDMTHYEVVVSHSPSDPRLVRPAPPARAARASRAGRRRPPSHRGAPRW